MSFFNRRSVPGMAAVLGVIPLVAMECYPGPPVIPCNYQPIATITTDDHLVIDHDNGEGLEGMPTLELTLDHVLGPGGENSISLSPHESGGFLIEAGEYIVASEGDSCGVDINGLWLTFEISWPGNEEFVEELFPPIESQYQVEQVVLWNDWSVEVAWTI